VIQFFCSTLIKNVLLVTLNAIANCYSLMHIPDNKEITPVHVPNEHYPFSYLHVSLYTSLYVVTPCGWQELFSPSLFRFCSLVAAL